MEPLQVWSLRVSVNLGLIGKKELIYTSKNFWNWASPPDADQLLSGWESKNEN